VVEVGTGVSDLRIGDRRIVLRGDTGVSRAGTFAERVAVAASSLVSIPTGWSDEEAAGATLVYLTAYQALTQWGELPPSVVLVTGASGGVGVASIQLGTAMGHRVIALSRDPIKQQRLIELGAVTALDSRDAEWRERLKQFLDNRRVDLAIDNIGGTLLPEVIGTLGDRGKLSVVGQLAGPVPHFNTASLFFRRIRIGGVAVGSYTNAESHAAWDDIQRLLAGTKAMPLVDHIFPFDELPAAFARLAKGPLGKVLLRVGA
jgi:NADPH2:quinone reductase